ncbi:hypothetical protein AMIS_28980 [Actinoplanes missouriensis 431]|uniref:Uncharacterized protein n=1 Tax=Actinoplanes missouriensis (strain ATCC 14538 / DSM 43046 / CBS 188.64 / JCM 3121 / NBRC 102363 / NCIMB 12654 / NRRL B-3342 / UNCC 431) TaxID=512565 RepID=I0H531_ACTM4|nr:hypothetical protein AMIS_28980 [Actinoplanes missouriensis 431]
MRALGLSASVLGRVSSCILHTLGRGRRRVRHERFTLPRITLIRLGHDCIVRGGAGLTRAVEWRFTIGLWGPARRLGGDRGALLGFS